MATTLEAARSGSPALSVVDEAALLLAQVRASRPRVHCLTSPVALEISANALLALGAVPSLTADAATVAELVRGADALMVNLGMLDPARSAANEAAVEAAREAGRPWLLDPVMVERSEARTRRALDLLAGRPALIRGNAAEIAALAGTGLDAPRRLARAAGCIVACTGPEDRVTDGETILRIANGSALMDRVTALGCAVSALTGAFLAVAGSPRDAAAAALLVAGVAGELAEVEARGPASFAVAWLDALYRLTGDDLRARSRIA